jgi:hypothetical protein
MAAHGEVGPMPDTAVFADVKCEPRRVYEHLRWLVPPKVLPFPIHAVSAGDIRANILRGARGHRWASIPAFTKTITPAGTRVLQYQKNELSAAAFSDKRLARRLRRLLDQMSAAPGKPIPAACGDWAAAKAAYRFFDNRV